MRAQFRKLLRLPPRVDVYPTLNSFKKEIIDYATWNLGMQSFADMGGVWEVGGGYSFYTAERHGKSGAIVDSHFTENVLNRLERFPNLRAIVGNFGTPEVRDKVGKVDALFFFDTLLHQVRPDWDEVLEMYAGSARIFLIHNQQYTNFPKTTRLLDLGVAEYFRNTPHIQTEEPLKSYFRDLDAIHPEHNRPYRDVHSIWQWGITDADLISRMLDLGFKLEFFRNCGQFGELKNVENHSFIFQKRI